MIVYNIILVKYIRKIKYCIHNIYTHIKSAYSTKIKNLLSL